MIKGFKLIGIEVRTTNLNNQAANDLGNLWAKFLSENLLECIPNKLSDEILAIYTDYESDYKGAYAAILGVRVSSLALVPEGLIGREFPQDNFLKFTAKGVMPNAVVESWIHIWEQDKELNRKYSYDFELYGERSQQGDSSEVDIYIATLPFS
ncbi:GyrI-like domain-containing protein [Sphingobacterium sp. UT-1RO-CII-1]|uniref:GyrI-like domain-containing protein n=1 Tax=Sphingobacterium sp. UT-1RO-CII-1 TaxID=2995225 RepID=UPI00227AE7A1|nr:GyrI-like domain-containing protein [Sphingobacterium sp. UT-1RO-CII-1]MCY4781265.1 GyrI-like domain-containing protein [Sphingobacterium sp. UT-1RO-CII-1]